jgi:hypothetical protein
MLIHRQNSYAPCGTPVAMKRRAMELVNKVKILPVYHKYIYMSLDVLVVINVP